jgi:hypothetical protein
MPPPARRPFFAEAAKLGLMTSGATIGGPLGQALSTAAKEDLKALLTDLVKRGLALDCIGDADDYSTWGNRPQTPDRVATMILESNGDLSRDDLVVSGPHMKYAPIEHVSDLEGVEPLALDKDPSRVPESPLAQTLLDLGEKAGVRYYVNYQNEDQGMKVLENIGMRKAREVGPYGAWRALREAPPKPDPDAPTWREPKKPDAGRLWVGREDPRPFSFSFRPKEVPVPVPDASAVERTAFFELGAPSPTLDADPLAVSLRDLEKRGYTFHFPWTQVDAQRTALGLYGELQGERPTEVLAGVRGAGKEKVTVEQLCDPARLSDSLKGLSRFFDDHVAGRLKDGTFDDRDANLWVEAAALPMQGLSVEKKGELLEKLYAFERERVPDPGFPALRASTGLKWMARLLRPSENPDGLLDETIALGRRGLMPETSGEAIEYFRNNLSLVTFDDADFQTQREQLVKLAALSHSFKDALDAASLISYTLPFDQGYKLLAAAVETDSALEPPKEPEDPQDFSLKTPPTPFQQAMEDYKLVLAHRYGGESPEETAATLRSLHTVLVDRVGFESSRQAFVFIQRGAAHGAFGEFTRDMAAVTFADNFSRNKDLEAACRSALRLGKTADAAKITVDDSTGDLVVGGIRIRKRSS